MNEENNEKQIKILVATPAYNSVVNSDYLHSILSYSSVKQFGVTVVTLGNESLITRARNKLFTFFINNDFDYLFFLDADIYFNLIDFYNLLKAQKDIIGAPVRLKSDTAVILNTKPINKETFELTDDGLVEVEKIGTAVLLISRKLALDMVKYCEENNDIYISQPGFSRGHDIPIKDNKVYDVFQVGRFRGEYPNGEYLSEDYYFCKLARFLGYKVYADYNAVTVHNGTLQLPYTPKMINMISDNNNNSQPLPNQIDQKQWI